MSLKSDFDEHAGGSWDAFHTVAYPTTIPQNVWERHQFERWQPCNLTRWPPEGPGAVFTLVQSTTGISCEEIWAKIEPCVNMSKAAAPEKEE